MLTTTTTELIHRVLDGEASEAQTQELQRVLAADPAARAEFDAAERLFADFKSVPQRHPPEGLVAAVMAAVEVPAAKSRRSNQPFSRPRVLGSRSRDDSARASPDTHRNSRFQSFLRSIDMSQQTRSPFGSRKIWIGSAIALAAVVGVTQFGLDGKTNEKDVIGTIAPAERYRAPQATGADIKVGTPTGGQTGQVTPTSEAAAGGQAAATGAKAAAGGEAAAIGAKAAAGGEAAAIGAKAAAGGEAAATGAKAAAGGEAAATGAKAAAGGQAAATGAKAAAGGEAAATGAKAAAGGQAAATGAKATATGQ